MCLIPELRNKLLKKEFFIKDLNLFIDSDKVISCEVKIRYRSHKQKCTIFIDDGKVVLEDFASGIAPGQVSAFYHDKKVIGSAIILK